MNRKEALCNLSIGGQDLLAIEEAIVDELVLLIQIAGIQQCNYISAIADQLKKMLLAHKHANPDTSICEVVHDWQDFVDIRINEVTISLTIDDIKKLAMMRTSK